MEGIKSYNSEQLRILPPSATVFCAARKAVENAEEPLQWIGFRIAATRKGVNRPDSKFQTTHSGQPHIARGDFETREIHAR